MRNRSVETERELAMRGVAVLSTGALGCRLCRHMEPNLREPGHRCPGQCGNAGWFTRRHRAHVSLPAELSGSEIAAIAFNRRYRMERSTATLADCTPSAADSDLPNAAQPAPAPNFNTTEMPIVLPAHALLCPGGGANHTRQLSTSWHGPTAGTVHRPSSFPRCLSMGSCLRWR
jgi:hypothetical protein